MIMNKSQSIELTTKTYEESFLEPELRPEYIEKLQKIRKGKYSKTFNSIDELDSYIKSRKRLPRAKLSKGHQRARPSLY